MSKKISKKITVDIGEFTFTKQQFLNSEKLQDSRDIINAILEDDKKYTLEDLKNRITEFSERKV